MKGPILTRDGRPYIRSSGYPAEHAVERDGGVMLVRAAAPFEARETADGAYEIVGYGLQWSEVADIGGWFNEQFREGAFANVLDGVRQKVGHDYSRVALARSPKTMRVFEDSTGLGYESRLDLRSPYAQDLMVAVDRGDVDRASIGFTPGDYEYSEDANLYLNTRVDRLWEISAVDYPAFESSRLEPRDLPERAERDTMAIERARLYADSLLRELPTMEAME